MLNLAVATLANLKKKFPVVHSGKFLLSLFPRLPHQL